MENPLAQLAVAQKKGQAVGMYSICSANRFVLEAAMLHAKADRTAVLIESTSNQVDQYGGYSGMTPRQFFVYVKEIAKNIDFPFHQVILGGDHLGPNRWQGENARDALAKAQELVRAYVCAGFKKIHLDASMRCADDAGDEHRHLPVSIVVQRTAELCKICEATFHELSVGFEAPVYVIGTEVPAPGGATEELARVQVTRVEDVKQTIELMKQAFLSQGLQSAWKRVIAVVVQPGVVFSDVHVIDYCREKTRQLSRFIESYDNLIYEAHSTDYQRKEALRQMVEDHFAILKVGPALTFAFREAVFALANMESEWLSGRKSVKLSHMCGVLEKVMRANPEHWRKHYHGDEADLSFAQKYSFSDRVRYYWPEPEVQDALGKLFENLSENPVPITLLSQYMPVQYQALREGRLSNMPEDLIRNKIAEVLKNYSYATRGGESVPV